ncbi:septation initiation protein, partial [Escherichia coli]|nr:septation initiation protein [Escherichia coli]
MTTVNQISDANITSSLPPKIREAVEKVKAAKAVWQEERRKQTEAAAMIETIRKRQEDTKTETQALNADESPND